ncbi:hypothetical protein F5Y13DRAFT_200075 [Hypoxylon sp. FL1857]|nr:hypothetical protein F5Y13DRAFT_200075 [Hypoxylon sp. FL1857]
MESQHKWKDPAHCDTCRHCALLRERKLQHSSARALLAGRLRAQALGHPVPPLPRASTSREPTSRTRTFRVPLAVTIQVPGLADPVAPDEPVRLEPGQRKRSFSHLQPSHNQFHAPASGLLNFQSTPATVPVIQEG